MKNWALCCATIVLVMQGSAAGQSLLDDPRLASALHLIGVWIEAQVDYEDIPGMSVGIVHDQKLVWSRGFGYADLKRKAPARADTIYSICSISKLFTSTAVMQLRDQGKLRLDDPVRKHLPWFRIKDTYPDAPEATIEALLTHSSGLPREADFPYWSGPDFSFPTREQIIERISKQEELYPADTYYQYSNLGLTLAGEVVAAVSGQPYAEYMKNNVLDPLGLEDTTPEMPEEHRGGRLATGYSRRMRDGNREVMPFFLVRGIAPAAGFASTVPDLGRFASWQFRLLDKGGREVLAANTLKEMHRVHWLDPDWQTTRGIGYSVTHRDGKVFVGHGGSCPGYRTDLLMRPKEKIAVIVMTNGHDVSPSFYGNRIYDIVAPAIQKTISAADEAEKADPELEKYVGRYDRPLGGESHVLIYEGSLAVLSLPTENPLGLTKLKHVGDNTFRRIRDDGELGEAFLFELGPDGRATRMIRNSNYAVRVP